MSPSNRSAVIVIAVVVVVLVASVVVLLSSHRKAATPAPVAPEISISPSPDESSSPSPGIEPTPEGDENAQETQGEHQIVAYYSQPILKAVPHTADFWSLDVVSHTSTSVALTATVYYTADQDPQATINQQKPFIDAYVRKTGQPAGSYTIEYHAQSFDGE